MRNFLRKLAVVSALLLPASQAHALYTPLAVAVLAPVQFPPTSFTIVGARASVFWGDHRDVYGLDVGAIGNITENSFAGIGVSGIFNYNHGTATVIGLQAAGLANVNVNKAKIIGLQISAGVNSNVAESTVVGLQIAMANLAHFTDVWGVQAGVYNQARNIYGFQLGLVNFAESLHGIQIGLANFNHTGLFSFSPILNIGF